MGHSSHGLFSRSVIGNETEPERRADLISSPCHTAALVLSGSDQATCCFGFLFTLCVCTQCVPLSIFSVTCLLFAKLFCCKIGQIEKHGRSLCGFHGLFKNAYKLRYEHFVILHQKRLIEKLKIFKRLTSGS